MDNSLLNIYTDFLASILILLKKSQTKNSPFFITANKLSYLLQLRKNKEFSTNFYHVYSHTLDGQLSEEELNRKLNNMRYKFQNNYLYILQGNFNADLNASKNKFPILPMPGDSPFLPQFYLIINSQIILDKVCKSITELLLKDRIKQWEKTNPKYKFIFNNEQMLPRKLFPQLPCINQNFYQRTIFSLLPTKKRTYTQYLKKLSPAKRLVYNNKICSLCKVEADHMHILEQCKITQAIKKHMAIELQNLFSKHDACYPVWTYPPPPNRQLSSNLFLNMDPFWRARGILPPTFCKVVEKDNLPMEMVLDALKILGKWTRAAWIAQCNFTYKRIKSPEEIWPFPTSKTSISSYQ